MKSIAALALLAATVAAQSPEELRGQLPECALSCIEGAAAEVGCETGDYACECEKQKEVTVIASKCQSDLDEAERCSGTDLAKALSVADEICEAVKAGGGDEEDSDDEADTTDGGDASATESASDAEKTDDASETGSDDKPSSTDSDDAEESGAGGEEGGEEGGDSAQDGEEGAAVKLGSYGWAGAAAAAVALIF